MAKFAYNLDADVRAASAMASALIPYIYQDELFGRLPPPLPSLTVGGLIMRLNRLTAIDPLLSADQRQAIAVARNQFDAMKQEWLVAYENKVKQEIGSRLRAVGQMLIDCSDRRQCAELYPSEIEKRVIAAGLHDEARPLNILDSVLSGQFEAVDGRLHMVTHPGDFLWDERLRPAYPPDAYWYLYVTLAR